jgi:transcription elongation factor GreA
MQILYNFVVRRKPG